MTDQEIFDTVARHLWTQGRRAMAVSEEGIYCAYRGPDGVKCAMGCLIPDKDYHVGLEGFGIGQLPERIQTLLGADREDRRNLLDDLQRAHDEPRNWEAEPFPRKAVAAVARKFGLSAAVLGTLPRREMNPKEKAR